VIAVARTADVVIMMLDATKGEIQKYVLYCLYCSVIVCDANSAIFQLYHGENKLTFNEMMMRSALY
jgi:ribosome-interacting GTPase 1